MRKKISKSTGLYEDSAYSIPMKYNINSNYLIDLPLDSAGIMEALIGNWLLDSISGDSVCNKALQKIEFLSENVQNLICFSDRKKSCFTLQDEYIVIDDNGNVELGILLKLDTACLAIRWISKYFIYRESYFRKDDRFIRTVYHYRKNTEGN